MRCRQSSVPIEPSAFIRASATGSILWCRRSHNSAIGADDDLRSVGEPVVSAAARRSFLRGTARLQEGVHLSAWLPTQVFYVRVLGISATGFISQDPRGADAKEVDVCHGEGVYHLMA